MQKQQASILSILIPTYNESQNILKLLEEIKDNLLDHIYTEIIIVDDIFATKYFR
jgi:dolichol-phosphate mannosyltransferase